MDIINIGIFANIDAGKTSLTEQIYSNHYGIVSGSIKHGTTLSDSDVIEQRRGISIFSSVIPIYYHGKKFNIVDTPGHFDFYPEVLRAISMIDVAVVVIALDQGITAHTRRIITELNEQNNSIIIFINKYDQESYRYQYHSIKKDVLSLLNKKPIIICGSATKNIGVTKLMDKLYHVTPTISESNNLEIEVFKIQNERCYVKVKSGVLKKGFIFFYNHKRYKIIAIYEIQINSYKKINEAVANDFVVVEVTSKILKTFDVIYKQQLIRQDKPIIQGFRIQIKSQHSEDNHILHNFLNKLTAIEPNYDYFYDPITKKMTVNLLGDTHKSVLKEYIYNQLGIIVNFSFPKLVSCRKILSTVELMIKVNHPDNQYAATMKLRIEAIESQEVKFISQVSLGYLKQSYQTAIENSIRQLLNDMTEQYFYSYCCVTLVYAEFYSGVSTPSDFRNLSLFMMNKMLDNIEYKELFPREKFEISVPKKFSKEIFYYLFNETVYLTNYTYQDSFLICKGICYLKYREKLILMLKKITLDDYIYESKEIFY